MKRFVKKCAAVALCVSLTMCYGVTALAAERGTEDTVYEDSEKAQEELLQQMQYEAAKVNADEKLSVDEKTETGYVLCNEAAEKLNELGYETYVVNSGNYDDVEAVLNTDLSVMGVDRTGNYIISISGEEAEDGISLQSSTGSSFSYTYQGMSYQLRYVTVTAADNSNFVQTKSCDLLESSSETLIKNALNTAIYTLADAVSGTIKLGTIMSILGLGITDFGPGTTTMQLHGGANWTRVFTEVYLPQTNQWVIGSCVEYAQSYAYVSGMYYSANTNRMEQLPQGEKRETLYSSKYNDYEWRKREAVIYAINGAGCHYDLTGAVKIYYGDEKKFTFSEYF